MPHFDSTFAMKSYISLSAIRDLQWRLLNGTMVYIWIFPKMH